MSLIRDFGNSENTCLSSNDNRAWCFMSSLVLSSSSARSPELIEEVR